MSTEKMTTPEKISFCRQNGMKINELSTRLNVSRQFVNLLYRGTRQLSIEKQAILDAIVRELSECKPSVDTDCKQLSDFLYLKNEMEKIESRLSTVETLLLDVIAKNKKDSLRP